MNVCLVGKYPPIEGGVSAQTYWLARGLAARGHTIHVVTNADEVEEEYRLLLQDDDAPWLQAAFDNGGRVLVHNVAPFSRSAMGHIPIANPFVSRLASLATDVIRCNDCEAILAYYFEPYGVAGWLASRWTDRPLLVKHAGSDLDRLCRVPDLATTYKEVLRSAAAVVTQPRLMPRFIGMGVDPSRLERDPPFSVPADVFNREGAVLNLERVAIPWGAENQTPKRALHNVPVIGIFGKIGITKGTWDLIAALGHLAQEGISFRFAAMIGRKQGENLLPALQDARIVERTSIIPMLPNWRIPSFVRACTAVCFLERDFPVAIHGPVIPREVLACGTCLVLSEEIASKQRYRDGLIPSGNVFVVADPKDHDELTGTLRRITSNPAEARAMGARGHDLSRSIERHDEYIDGWEALLTSYTCAAPLRTPRKSMAFSSESGAQSVRWLLPDLIAYLQRVHPSVVEGFQDAGDGRSLFDRAIRFCDFVARQIAEDGRDQQTAKIVTVLSYARERLLASCDLENESTAVFPVVDRLHGARVSRDSAWNLRPVRGSTVRIVPFEYDVSGLTMLATIGGHEAAFGDDEAELSAVEAAPILVLFHRAANLSPCELRIDEPTRALVGRCDGLRTTRQVADEMCSFFGAETSQLVEEVAAHMLAALDRLYSAGVIAFGERREGWGWVGGDRGTI